MTPDAIKELQKPLAKDAVKPAKQYGPKGDYIEGWFAIAEANRIFGHDAWSYHVVDCHAVAEKPREIGRDKKPGYGVTYIATVRVVVGDVIREDVGSGHGYDIDVGLAHESAIKEAVTDALKRGLRTFGWPLGLALYDKSRENVASEPAGNSASRGAGGGSSPAAPASAPITFDKRNPAHVYVIAALRAITTGASVEDLRDWWDEEKPNRDGHGITKGTPLFKTLFDAMLARKADLEYVDRRLAACSERPRGGARRTACGN